MMRDFKKLNIWNEGIKLVKMIYMVIEELPENEKFGLINQIRRAAISIPSNIAEGCSRNSQLEYKRFLEIALGAAFEIETQFIIIQELKMLNKEAVKRIIDQILSEQKQISSLISRIKIDLK